MSIPHHPVRYSVHAERKHGRHTTISFI
jgi:hypothetical protein